MLARKPTPPDPPTLDEQGAIAEAESPPRVISPRMLAVLQKVDADHAEHLADLLAKAQRDADLDGAERAARKARAGKWAAGKLGPKKKS
jgi:tripartite-type tricarboxylate transporter receptor subunit TctC